MTKIYVVINGTKKEINQDKMDKEIRFWMTYCFMNHINISFEFKEVNINEWRNLR